MQFVFTMKNIVESVLLRLLPAKPSNQEPTTKSRSVGDPQPARPNSMEGRPERQFDSNFYLTVII